MKDSLTDINAVRALLDRHGFNFSKALGQNFLVAEWVPTRISESAGLDEKTGVLEIGPGIGCLTAQLARRAAKVVSVELDKTLKPLLAETLEGYDNIELVFGDVLKENIPALVKDRLQGLRPVVCANLPYNVTTPVLTALVKPEIFDSITVMLQREVALRICAGPGTEAYGAFGIFVQWYCEAELLFDVPPSCFIPQPKVTSSVIRLKKRERPLCEVKDTELFFKVVRAAFNQRRKTLVNALSAAFGGFSKSELAEIVEACGFDARVRGERLSIQNFCLISDKMWEKSQNVTANSQKV